MEPEILPEHSQIENGRFVIRNVSRGPCSVVLVKSSDVLENGDEIDWAMNATNFIGL